MKKLAVSYLCLFALLLGVADTASAITVTASELIEDVPDLDLFDRNLRRTRTSTALPTVVEGSDATIVAENQVDGDFGFLTTNDVSYRHDLTWLNPTPTGFVNATLEITAAGAILGDDRVFVDTINIGSLANNILIETSAFASGDPVLLGLLFADGYLNVFIDKNRNAQFPANLNASVIFQSKLTVQYEGRNGGGQEVPEASTIALMLLGLGGLVAAKRAKSV